MRLVLLWAARQQYLSGDDLRKLLGRFTWAALLRPELLAVLHASYKFVETAGSGRIRMWPAVAKELRQAAALIAFAWADTKRPWTVRAYASDSSGSDAADHGGSAWCSATSTWG